MYSSQIWDLQTRFVFVSVHAQLFTSDPFMFVLVHGPLLPKTMNAALSKTPGLKGSYDVETAIIATPNENHLLNCPASEEKMTAGLKMGHFAEDLSYSAHQTFVCPFKDDQDMQLRFYLSHFCRSVIKKVASQSLKKTNIDCPHLLWRVFSLNYGTQLSKQLKDQLHQQWLCNINRQVLFEKYNGQYHEYPNFTRVLKHLHLRDDMSLFIHLKLNLDSFQLNDVDSRSAKDLMASSGAILAVLCNKQVLVSNDGNTTTKRRKIDIKLFANPGLHSMKQARLGSMLFWCNEIIPYCVEKVNQHQTTEYPLYCGLNSHSVCNFIILALILAQTKVVVYCLFFIIGLFFDYVVCITTI